MFGVCRNVAGMSLHPGSDPHRNSHISCEAHIEQTSTSHAGCLDCRLYPPSTSHCLGNTRRDLLMHEQAFTLTVKPAEASQFEVLEHEFSPEPPSKPPSNPPKCPHTA